jgi:hypothetical protein
MSCTEDRQRQNQSQELNEEVVKDQYQVTVTNRTASLENLEDNVDFNWAWDNIGQKIKI